MMAIPSLVTFVGLVLGLLGVALWPRPVSVACLLLGWACDGLDGALARRLGVVTPWGASLDLLVDIGLTWWSVERLTRCHPVWFALLLPVLAVEVTAHAKGYRASGRSVMTVLLVALALAKPLCLRAAIGRYPKREHVG